MFICTPLSTAHLSQLCSLPSSYPAYSLCGRKGRDKVLILCRHSSNQNNGGHWLWAANAKCCTVWTAVKKLTFITASQPDQIQPFFQNTSHLAYTWFQWIITSHGIEWNIGGSELFWSPDYSLLEGLITPFKNFMSINQLIQRCNFITL